MRRMLRCASAWLRVGGSFGVQQASLCVIRGLSNNGLTGPILASMSALTRLAELYAAPPPCGLPAESGVQTGTLWRRNLAENRFSGSVPSTISALTALTYLCAPTRGRAPAMW